MIHDTTELIFRSLKFSVLRKQFLLACCVAVILIGMRGSALAADDALVSFSYDAISSNQYINDWPNYEEDTIFAPNADNIPSTPDIRFIGKGAGSAIDTDAISYGYSEDPTDIAGLSVYFSVSTVTQGLLDTGVENEPVGDRTSDIYRSEIDGDNEQIYDGNGLGMQPGAQKLGLMEIGSTHIDGLDMRATWDQNLGPQPMPEKRFYWSVIEANGFGGAVSQPEYALAGYSGRDIFVGQPASNYSNNPAGVSRYADGGDLGLTEGDDIDGLVIVELDADPDDFDPQMDLVFFSLNSFSSSLSLPDFGGGVANKSGADIFYVGNGVFSPKRLYTAGDLGLEHQNGDIMSFDFAHHEKVRNYMTAPEPATLTLVFGSGLLPLLRSGRKKR